MIARLFVLAALAVAASPAEKLPEQDPLASRAAEFARWFLEGDYARSRERMDAALQSAVPRERAATIRRELLGGQAVARVGDAWLESTTADHRRYRVPVHLEDSVFDLRVVFDRDEKVVGFFVASHVDPLPERALTNQDPAPELTGRWEGSIATPGVELTVQIELSCADGRWSGTADIPMQGARSLPLTNIRTGADEIEFALADVPGDPTFRGKLVAGEIKGTFTQAGQALAFALRPGELAPPTRPQEPRPPFPYDDEEVSYPSGDVTLAGTLTLPSAGAPVPAVLLISGSGAQDRNEEIFEHKPFLVLADHLTRAGIAVLRVDDRGIGGSSGSVAESTAEDFARDVLAGVAFLKARQDIDAGRIGLIGHSEGGIVAPLAASRSEDVAFVVMLAGTGVPGREVLTRQTGRIARAAGADGAAVERIQAELAKTTELIVSGAADEQVREQARRLVEAQLGAADPETVARAVNEAMSQMNTVWFRSFLAHDPRPALRELRLPVLVLNGELDLQVDPEQNVPEIRKALEQAGNTRYTVEVLPGLNHLFQKAETGSPGEYHSIEETVNPAALDAIRDWISAVSAAGGP